MKTTQHRVTGSVRALSAVMRDTQHDLAAVLGITQTSVAHKLGGKIQWSLKDLELLAAHYGVTIDQLTAGPWAWLGRADGEGDNVRYPALGASELDGPAEFPPIESTLVAA